MKVACFCGAKLVLPDGTTAKRVRCPKCKQSIEVPESISVEASTPTELDKKEAWVPELQIDTATPVAFPPVKDPVRDPFSAIDINPERPASLGSPGGSDVWPAPWLHRRLVFAARAWDLVAIVGLFFSMLFVLGGVAILLIAISRGDTVQGVSVAGGLFVGAIGSFFSALPFRTLASVLYLLAGSPR
ncbi:zinc ribbon domain-containing protein [Paludisphaera rhizosphaerae]|uniref:hypothetical protein n=1 Tax=Paludisphaera rhizosphaerae TaxID=2711216 RepID=UPI0013E9B16F|nr:hypothetical protein [Paludisphaera rhizosphaerae]